MTRILILESSLFPSSRSASRQITDFFVKSWLGCDPGIEIVRRDLAAEPLPHFGLDAIEGWATPIADRTDVQAKAVASSERLISELLATDVLVVGAPMYNFSIPSLLKAWIDHIAIAGRTFRYTPDGRPEGLVTGKRVFIIASRGGTYAMEPMKAFNFQDTYLLRVLGFLGMTDVTVIAVERQKMGSVEQAEGLASARSQVVGLLHGAFG